MRLFNRMDFYFIGQMQWPLVIDQMHLQGFYLWGFSLWPENVINWFHKRSSKSFFLKNKKGGYRIRPTPWWVNCPNVPSLSVDPIIRVRAHCLQIFKASGKWQMAKECTLADFDIIRWTKVHEFWPRFDLLLLIISLKVWWGWNQPKWTLLLKKSILWD